MAKNGIKMKSLPAWGVWIEIPSEAKWKMPTDIVTPRMGSVDWNRQAYDELKGCEKVTPRMRSVDWNVALDYVWDIAVYRSSHGEW